MLKRHWRVIATAVGLGVALLLAAVTATWLYASPQQPDIPRYERPKGPAAEYQPGGPGCAPQRLDSLPANEAPNERERCAQERENHRIQQENLNLQVRSVDLAEANMRLAVRQAWSGFIQTIATVLAFFAAAVAAIAAIFAANYAKKSAVADGRNLAATRIGLRKARADAIDQADRSDKQITIAQRSANAAMRANQAMIFVSQGAFRITQFGINPLSQVFPRFEMVLSIRNVGKSPCCRLNIRTECEVMVVPSRDKSNNPYRIKCSGYSGPFEALESGGLTQVVVTIRPHGGPNDKDAEYNVNRFGPDDLISFSAFRCDVDFDTFFGTNDGLMLRIESQRTEANPTGRYPAELGRDIPLSIQWSYMGQTYDFRAEKEAQQSE